jgi:hypothetical protein
LKKLGPFDQAPYLTKLMREARTPAEAMDTAATYGGLGGLLGLALGLAGTVSGSSAGSRVLAGIRGLALGAATGVAVSFLIVPAFFRFYEPNSELLVSALTHGAIWAAIGAACGLTLGLALPGRSLRLSAMLGGLIGGGLGTLVYEMASAVAFPLAEKEAFIPTLPTARLIAHLSVAGLVALGAALCVSGRPVRSSRSTT